MTDPEKIDQEREEFTDDLTDEALDRAEGAESPRASCGTYHGLCACGA